MQSANGLQGKREDRGNQVAIITSSPLNNRAEDNTYCKPAGQNNCDPIDESDQCVNDSNKAGSRYSLRSQFKRPINSLESNQSHKQLTKKPALGSKQFSTLKLMQKCQKQLNPQGQEDEIFTSEIALNVDLIVESLFRYMNCTTLKACRLVCRRWKYFGAKELQRRRNVTTKFSFGYVIDKSEKSVRSLLPVMQNSDPNTFPFASFDILTEELSNPRITNFFSVVEARNPIKKLNLTLNYEKKKLPWNKSTLLEDLQNLLFRLVPNLEDLEICFYVPSHWADGLNSLDSGFFHLENSAYLLPKLTSLNLSGTSIPRKLFEDVMDAAVNLQSYAGCHFAPEQLGYFVDGNGKHRIHLLKRLHFCLRGAFVEVIERLVSHHGENLKLETFFFVNFWTRLNGRVDFWPRASSVINQLFLSSTSTMTSMGITPMRFLPGLAIPRLPNLSFIHVVGFIEDENDIANHFLFPPGFSLAKNFPNLRTVIFVSGSTLKSLQMLNITEPVTSVKHIWIADKNGIDDGTRARLHAAFPSVVLIEEGM